jgi:hypothetical protein
MRLKGNSLCGDRSLPRRRPRSCSSTVFGARSLAGTGNFVSLSHPGRDRAPSTTPVEIDGATQVWHLSAHCAQFRAPAFPSSVPCRSRCRAPARLARARTSDDIRPRALGTPPRKSLALPPTPSNAAIGIRCGQHGFAPGVHFTADSGLCATANIVGAAGPHARGKSMRYELRAINFHLGKHHPENHKGDWSAPVVRHGERV